jgi:hypothetical protein
MVDVDIIFSCFVYVDFEVGDIIFCFGGDDEVIGW